MSHRHIRLLATLTALAVSGSLAGCGSSASSSAPLAHSIDAADTAASHPSWKHYTFVVGDNGGDGSQALAQITGAFADAPYKVTFARFTYGPPLVQATASGAIDIGSVGDVPPLTGAASEDGFKVVAVERSLHPTQPDEDIIVPKGSPLRSLSQLRGKTIAVPQGSSAHGLALLALKSVGLSPADVHLDFLSPAAGATAFASKKVDAWAIWNPQAALALSQGARILAKGLPPIDQTSSYYVASDKVLDNPDERAALSDLLQRLGAEFAWGVKHPASYEKALTEEDGISLAEAAVAIKAEENRITPVTSADITAEQQLSNAFVAAGQIPKRVDVSPLVENILPAGYNSATAAG